MLSQGRLFAHQSGQIQVMDEGWEVLATAAGQFQAPGDLSQGGIWSESVDRGTAAATLRQLGQWSLDGQARRFDAEDWWYRHQFDLPGFVSGQDYTLGLDGLATIAEVWLNGQRILGSDNMFLAHRCSVGDKLKVQANELVMVFRSLDQALAKRRPRPRWRAPMIENQQIRWFRTTVLGRAPGWTPPAAAVGPWRPVWLAPTPSLSLSTLSLQPKVSGEQGRLSVAVSFDGAKALAIESVKLCLSRAEESHELDLTGPDRWQGCLTIEQVALWWPHTHGDAPLYEARLRVSLSQMAEPEWLELGALGFRDVQVDQAGAGFRVRINGVPVFCRGACWTPLDIVTLDGANAQAYRDAIAQIKLAGMNMIRLGGTMTYEADAFYDECDRQGVMVWQEWMFANMDYPEDADFLAGVDREVQQQMQRWQGRPCITVLCGNSEVEQQAAMFGATRDKWTPVLFHEVLARASQAGRPDVPYWPSSAHGGAFPHQGDAGTTSYYGVGAYMRPLDDARRSNLKFATECLAFANVPEASGIAAMPGGLGLRVHHGAWKARTPRDLGAGWDFEDVRDHYVSQLFDVDPTRLRYSDHDRYLTLGRVAVGEVMSATFAEWRRRESSCGGALIWFLRDFWPGAGWGVIDSQGQPKSPYYYLKRALQPVSLALTDEGGNGLYVHLGNEGPHALHGEIEVTAYRHGHTQVGQGRQSISLEANGTASWPLMACFDWFADWSWAYRFGPASANVLSAVLRGTDGEVKARAFAFPTGMALPLERQLGLKASARLIEPGVFELAITTDSFAQAVHLDVDDLVPDDAYFHMAPGQVHTVCLRTLPGKTAPTRVNGSVRALNLDGSITIQMEGNGS